MDIDSREPSYKPMALKPYLECIAQYCSRLSKQELLELLLNLAKSEKASGRKDFLLKLQSFLPDAAGESDEQENGVQDYLDDVQALKEDIDKRIACIENGDYELLDDFDWEHAGYEEEPDVLSEEQREELEVFFSNASDLFLDEHFQDAGMLYTALFDLFDSIDTDDFLVRGLDLDIHIREERARFARCIYEAFSESGRLEEFARAMKLDAPDGHLPHVIDESLPLLEDVIDAREEEMGDFSDFLQGWKELLARRRMNVRTASLLIEASLYLEGMEEVAGLARQWGNTQPYGYLFWMKTLLEQGNEGELIEVAEEALSVLQPGNAREKASMFLIEAARFSNRQDVLLKGKREQFFSNPKDSTLLGWLNEASRQKLFSEELDAVLAFWGRQEALDDSKKSLYIKSLLMAGRLDEAYQLVKGHGYVGWSFGLNVGVVFGALALALIDWNEDALILKNILAGYADTMDRYASLFRDEKDAPYSGFYDCILQAGDRVQISEKQVKDYLNWIFTIGRKRIEHIVSNKHRNAYRRAAEVLGSLAEVHAARGDDRKANRILQEYVKEQFSRHVAFRREVDSVLKTSGFRLMYS
ncbi:MAG: hypothetical protein K9J81_05580 [Desulfohalobiaceae bacterium]|nr:hypothetical protein [Desulfohalobiaceae bacterium]